ATASALQVSAGGGGSGSGTVTATNDGHGEKVTGAEDPPAQVFLNQPLLHVGVLAQEATADVAGDGGGVSAACAGVAGNGGSVLQIGRSRCLSPGDPITLGFADADLSKVLLVDPDSALAPLAEGNAQLASALASVTKPLMKQIQQTPLGTSSLGGSLGVVEAKCRADDNGATGSANIIDSKLTMNVAGQEVVLAQLPAHPAPNTNVTIDLDDVSGVILGAVRTQLTHALAAPGAKSGPLATLAVLPEQLQNKVVETLVQSLKQQGALKQLDQNVLHGVLNEQHRSNGKISVTAVDLSLLPAAKSFGLPALANVKIGQVTCGPNGEVTKSKEQPPVKASPSPTPEAPATTEPTKAPAVPTAVPAGMRTMPASSDSASHSLLFGGALGALLLGSVGAGIWGYRRHMGS
ncbi:MAG: hypothetical protein ACRDP4_10095, partial [Nocardioidaceae bacterium]